MTQAMSLNALWNSASTTDKVFRPHDFTHLPEVAQRYLNHAIAPGTPLTSAVRLWMHGEIKLKSWIPFRAEEVICWDRGMIWKASVRMSGLPLWGSDRLIDGEASLNWKLFGLFPVMTASGPDINRSAIGRVLGEAVWLPSVLCDPAVVWTSPNPSQAIAQVTMQGERTDLALTVDAQGRLECVQFARWGNPDGAAFGYSNFGGVVEAENTFGGYTIPTRLCLGWHFGTERFEPEGEFFRGTVDRAIAPPPST